MAFGIIRTKKINSYAGIVGVGMHNFREREVKNADQNKADLNVTLKAKTHAELVLSAKSIHETVERKIQKNAVLAIEYLVTASPDFFEGRNREDSLKFFQASLKHLQKKHGDSNVISATVHFDERTPHMHLVTIPVLVKEKKVTNPNTKKTKFKDVVSLDAGHWLGGFAKMKKLQNDFFDEVSKSFGLERGNEKQKATHVDIARWYAVKHKEESEGRLAPIELKRTPEISSPTIQTIPAEIGKKEKEIPVIRALSIYEPLVENLSGMVIEKSIREKILDRAKIIEGDTGRQILEKSALIEILSINRNEIDSIDPVELQNEIHSFVSVYESVIENNYKIAEEFEREFLEKQNKERPRDDRGR